MPTRTELTAAGEPALVGTPVTFLPRADLREDYERAENDERAEEPPSFGINDFGV